MQTGILTPISDSDTREPKPSAGDTERLRDPSEGARSPVDSSITPESGGVSQGDTGWEGDGSNVKIDDMVNWCSPFSYSILFSVNLGSYTEMSGQ